MALALLLAAFGLIAFNMIGYYTNVSEKSQEAQATIVAQTIASEIVEMERLYRNGGINPAENGTNVTLAEVRLDVPQKISGKPYSIELQPRGELWVIGNITASDGDRTTLEEERPYSRIVITTSGLPSITFTYNIFNVLILTEGSARNAGTIKLTYVRERVSTSSVSDKVVLSAV